MSGFDGDTECMMLDLNEALLVPFDIELVQADSNGVHHSTGFHSQRVPCAKKLHKRTWQNPNILRINVVLWQHWEGDDQRHSREEAK